jgi:type IV pilus assembly protein PilM
VDGCPIGSPSRVQIHRGSPITGDSREPPTIPARYDMAKREKNLVGLDIDPSGITAVAASVNGRVRVERAAVAPLEEGILRDGEVADADGLSAALRALYRDHKGLEKRVRVGVANQKIVVRVIDLPPLTDARELDAAVRFHAQDQLPMPLEQAVLDHQPLEVVQGDSGPRQRVLLVAARRDMVERLLAAVRGAGLRPEGIDLAAFAMVRALYKPSLADERVLYLSVGGLTNIAVAQGRLCLFTRTASTGLETLAVELAERKALTLEHAREWLTHVGLEQPLETIEGEEDIVMDTRHVLLAGARRIAADVRNSLDFHAMQGEAQTVSQAVLTGPASAVPGFAAAIASELAIPVEEGGVDGGADGIHRGRLSIAAGLALMEAPA